MGQAISNKTISGKYGPEDVFGDKPREGAVAILRTRGSWVRRGILVCEKMRKDADGSNGIPWHRSCSGCGVVESQPQGWTPAELGGHPAQRRTGRKSERPEGRQGWTCDHCIYEPGRRTRHIGNEMKQTLELRMALSPAWILTRMRASLNPSILATLRGSSGLSGCLPVLVLLLSRSIP